jgi:predicted nuclease of predicted toxin-antitoxin system
MSRLLADEHFPWDGVAFLRQSGHDIKAVIQEMPGAPDTEVLAFAIAKQRIIVTYDRDYGELIFKHGMRPPQGVIYLRKMEPDEHPGEIIHQILSTESFDASYKLSVKAGAFWRQRAY